MRFLQSIIFLTLAFPLTGCMSLFYYPSQEAYFNPVKLGLKFTDVEFKSETGDAIHAWWFDSQTQPSKGTVVFFHGNAENLTSHFANLAWLPAKGYSYLIFDYPGYGLSDGSPTPKSTVAAGVAAIRWVNKEKDQRPLIIYGNSLGGNVALRSLFDLHKQIPLKAIVIDASFPSYQKIAAGKLSSFWLTWPFQPLVYLLVSDKYAPGDLKELAPTPLLVIHGQKDLAVEPRWGELIFEQAAEPKQIWRIPDGVHGSTFWGHEKIYQGKLLEYLDGLSRN